MTSRIKCRKCGAESYADGATLFCRRCFDELLEVVEEMAQKPYMDSIISSIFFTLRARAERVIDKIRLAGYARREDWPQDDEAELSAQADSTSLNLDSLDEIHKTTEFEEVEELYCRVQKGVIALAQKKKFTTPKIKRISEATLEMLLIVREYLETYIDELVQGENENP